MLLVTQPLCCRSRRLLQTRPEQNTKKKDYKSDNAHHYVAVTVMGVHTCTLVNLRRDQSSLIDSREKSNHLQLYSQNRPSELISKVLSYPSGAQSSVAKAVRLPRALPDVPLLQQKVSIRFDKVSQILQVLPSTHTIARLPLCHASLFHSLGSGLSLMASLSSALLGAQCLFSSWEGTDKIT